MQKPKSFEQMHTGSLNSVCFCARRLKVDEGGKGKKEGRERRRVKGEGEF